MTGAYSCWSHSSIEQADFSALRLRATAWCYMIRKHLVSFCGSGADPSDRFLSFCGRWKACNVENCIVHAVTDLVCCDADVPADGISHLTASVWRVFADGCYSGGASIVFCQRVPWHQFTDPADWMTIGDFRERVTQIGLWVPAVVLGRLNDGVDGRGPFAAGV